MSTQAKLLYRTFFPIVTVFKKLIFPLFSQCAIGGTIRQPYLGQKSEFYGRDLLHPELQPITRFITKNKERSIGKEEKRMSLNIDKNGRIFAVERIIFQDDSFRCV